MSRANRKKMADLKAELDKLSDTLRFELFCKFCRFCGNKDPDCECLTRGL